jgi:hypothetical protein
LVNPRPETALPPIPDWLVPILQQFPIVALVIGVGWLVLKWADRWHARELDREVSRTADALRRADAEIARVEADRERSRLSHAADIDRMTEHLRAENARLRARVTALENRLSPGS